MSRIAVTMSCSARAQVTLQGTYHQVSAAFTPIFAKAVQAEAEKGVTGSEFTLKLLLSHAQVGSLIGKSGASIAALRLTTGTQVHVTAATKMPPGVRHRLLCIRVRCAGGLRWFSLSLLETDAIWRDLRD